MAGPARLFVKTQSRSELPPAHFGLVLAVEDDLSRQAQPADAIRMTDCRGRMRRLIVKGIGDGFCWGESDQSAFVEQGALVQLVRAAQVLAETRLAEIEHVEQPLVLKTGDLLVVTDERQAGRSPRLAPNGEIVEAARIPCTLPEAFAFVKPGERVAFDDGAIWGVVRKVTKTHLEIEITHAAPTGSKLGQRHQPAGYGAFALAAKKACAIYSSQRPTRKSSVSRSFTGQMMCSIWWRVFAKCMQSIWGFC